MKKVLCKPCAVDLAARGKTMKPAGGRWEKNHLCGVWPPPFRDRL